MPIIIIILLYYYDNNYCSIIIIIVIVIINIIVLLISIIIYNCETAYVPVRWELFCPNWRVELITYKSIIFIKEKRNTTSLAHFPISITFVVRIIVRELFLAKSNESNLFRSTSGDPFLILERCESCIKIYYCFCIYKI